MNDEEKIKLLELYGIPTDMAEELVEDDNASEDIAIVAAFRILKILNRRLEFILDGYKERLRSEPENVLKIERKLLELGVTPEDIAEYKYQTTLEGYQDVAAIFNDIDTADLMCGRNYNELCDRAPGVMLIEVVDGKPTGRTIMDLEQQLPFY